MGTQGTSGQTLVLHLQWGATDASRVEYTGRLSIHQRPFCPRRRSNCIVIFQNNRSHPKEEDEASKGSDLQSSASASASGEESKEAESGQRRLRVGVRNLSSD